MGQPPLSPQLNPGPQPDAPQTTSSSGSMKPPLARRPSAGSQPLDPRLARRALAAAQAASQEARASSAAAPGEQDRRPRERGGRLPANRISPARLAQTAAARAKTFTLPVVHDQSAELASRWRLSDGLAPSRSTPSDPRAARSTSPLLPNVVPLDSAASALHAPGCIADAQSSTPGLPHCSGPVLPWAEQPSSSPSLLHRPLESHRQTSPFICPFQQAIKPKAQSQATGSTSLAQPLSQQSPWPQADLPGALHRAGAGDEHWPKPQPSNLALQTPTRTSTSTPIAPDTARLQRAPDSLEAAVAGMHTGVGAPPSCGGSSADDAQPAMPSHAAGPGNPAWGDPPPAETTPAPGVHPKFADPPQLTRSPQHAGPMAELLAAATHHLPSSSKLAQLQPPASLQQDPSSTVQEGAQMHSPIPASPSALNPCPARAVEQHGVAATSLAMSMPMQMQKPAGSPAQEAQSSLDKLVTLSRQQTALLRDMRRAQDSHVHELRCILAEACPGPGGPVGSLCQPHGHFGHQLALQQLLDSATSPPFLPGTVVDEPLSGSQQRACSLPEARQPGRQHRPVLNQILAGLPVPKHPSRGLLCPRESTHTCIVDHGSVLPFGPPASELDDPDAPHQAARKGSGDPVLACASHADHVLGPLAGSGPCRSIGPSRPQEPLPGSSYQQGQARGRSWLAQLGLREPLAGSVMERPTSIQQHGMLQTSQELSAPSRTQICHPVPNTDASRGRQALQEDPQADWVEQGVDPNRTWMQKVDERLGQQGQMLSAVHRDLPTILQASHRHANAQESAMQRLQTSLQASAAAQLMC